VYASRIIWQSFKKDLCGKQNNRQSSSKTTLSHRKLSDEEARGIKGSPVSSVKLVMWRLFLLSNVGRSILSGTPQLVCQVVFSEKFEDQTRDDGTLCIKTMRALTHQHKKCARSTIARRCCSSVLEVSQSVWKKCFENWFERMYV